jgi:hypothetical protein
MPYNVYKLNLVQPSPSSMHFHWMPPIYSMHDGFIGFSFGLEKC